MEISYENIAWCVAQIVGYRIKKYIEERCEEVKAVFNDELALVKITFLTEGVSYTWQFNILVQESPKKEHFSITIQYQVASKGSVFIRNERYWDYLEKELKLASICKDFTEFLQRQLSKHIKGVFM